MKYSERKISQRILPFRQSHNIDTHLRESIPSKKKYQHHLDLVIS